MRGEGRRTVQRENGKARRKDRVEEEDKTMKKAKPRRETHPKPVPERYLPRNESGPKTGPAKLEMLTPLCPAAGTFYARELFSLLLPFSKNGIERIRRLSVLKKKVIRDFYENVFGLLRNIEKLYLEKMCEFMCVGGLGAKNRNRYNSGMTRLIELKFCTQRMWSMIDVSSKFHR